MDIDLRNYLKEGQIELEKIRIENGRLTGKVSQKSSFTKCTFNNVVFERQFDDDAVYYGNCEFVNCVFHGSLGTSYLILQDNLFKNCLFEDISMEFGGEKSYIVRNGFFDCNFINVKLVRDIEFISQTIKGGKIENASLLSSNMSYNQFLNLQMVDVRIMAFYTDNIMASVVFKDVTLEFETRVHMDDGNMFYQCDTSSLKCFRHDE